MLSSQVDVDSTDTVSYTHLDVYKRQADEEDNYHVAQANEKLDAEGHFIRNSVSGRYREETQEYDKSAFDYMDVSLSLIHI